MKVLHINWSGKLGGAEKFAYNLAKCQCRMGSGIVPTIAYMNKKLILGKRAEEQGIKVVEFNMGSGVSLINFMKAVFFIIREKFDVIHDHNGPPIVRVSKLFAPKSVFIQHIHGTKFGNERWERFRVILWKRATRWLVDHYIANSEHTKKMASDKEGIPLARISVIYNGIDLDEFNRARTSLATTIRKELGIKEKDWVVGTIANLTHAKGIDKFIHVAKEVCKDTACRGSTKFVVVGDGELRDELEQLVGALNLKERVIFAGAREDIPDVLAVFNVFLLTSNWEAFGISLVEAMAMGVPVIAFKVDGIHEVVGEGCGILIPPRIDEAVKAIIFLKENKSVAQSLVAKGVKLVNSKFNILHIAEKIWKVYNIQKPNYVLPSQ